MGAENEVLVETLNEAYSYLTRAVELLPGLTVKLRQGERQRPLQELANLAEGLELLRQLLQSGASLGRVDWDNWQVGETMAREAVDGFNAAFTKMVVALEQGDFIYLADLMAEDLPAALGQYRLLFREMAGMVKGAGPSA